MIPANRDQVLEDILVHVGLGDADRVRLTALCAKLAPQFSAIAQRFHDRLVARPATAALLTSAEQIARLHVVLIEWMTSGLLGPYDDLFYEKRARIGRRHVAIGLPQQYMFTAMNMLRSEYDDHIARLYEPHEARLVAKSVDKLLDVELALMLRHYQLDSEAKLVARERAAQADRVAAIQTLSAGLAHEIRNPLNSATLQLELLERRLRRDTADAKLVEPVELVHHELHRLTQLLNEFLSFARPSELVLGNHDVLVIARDVVASERPVAKTRGATLEVNGSGSLIARVDAQKLRQILQNLVHNALEAVSEGGRVNVTIHGDDDHLHLAVTDDGPGIPEVVQRRVYEPFFTTKDAGTGLGLSIVHGMVTQHGGTITIDSSPRGTRFDVRLPRRLG